MYAKAAQLQSHQVTRIIIFSLLDVVSFMRGFLNIKKIFNVYNFCHMPHLRQRVEEINCKSVGPTSAAFVRLYKLHQHA